MENRKITYVFVPQKLSLRRVFQQQVTVECLEFDLPLFKIEVRLDELYRTNFIVYWRFVSDFFHRSIFFRVSMMIISEQHFFVSLSLP